MTSLRQLSYREVKDELLAAGFEEHGSTRVSHRKFVKFTREGVLTAIVPYHGEIAIGTLRSILRQAGLTGEESEAPTDNRKAAGCD